MEKKNLVDVVIPVYNEERDLAQSVATLAEHLMTLPRFAWRIIIADNGSTDRTPRIAEELVGRYPIVRYIRIPEKGRGRALRQVWGASDADIVSYMDVDLSTDLEYLEELICSLTEGYDVSTGCRLHPRSRIDRSLYREILSRGYNFLLRMVFGVHFRDAQCGFKAATKAFVDEVVPRIEGVKWFFDTEMLILAEKNGYRIREIPVRWIEDPRSTVRVSAAIREDIAGILRLRFSRLRFRS